MDPNQLINLGVAGVMLFWFMRRVEDKLDHIDQQQENTRAAMDRLTRMLGLSLLHSTIGNEMRTQVQEVITEAEANVEYRRERTQSRRMQ